MKAIEGDELTRYLRHISLKLLFLVGLAAAILLIAVYASTVGPYHITFWEAMGSVFNYQGSTVDRIIWNLRLPRIVAAVLVGAALGASGTIMQCVLRNPLGSPFTGAFGTLRNTGAEDVHITGITSPVSTRVEMHETVPGGSGMMMQEKAGGFVVPAGGDLMLEPGGEHIMFMDLTDPVTTGQVVPLELTLDGGDELEISVTARDFKGGEEEYVGGGHGGSDAGDHGGHSGGHGEGMSHDG